MSYLFLAASSYLLVGALIGLRLAYVDPVGGERSWGDYALGAATGACMWPVILCMIGSDGGPEHTTTGIGFLGGRVQDAPTGRQPRVWEGEGDVFELWPGEAAQDRNLDRILAEHMGPPPDWQIEVWTPLEREIFGHNERLAFIAETDRILKELEWAQLKADKERAKLDMPDLSTMRVPGLPPAEEPETANLYTWGSPEPIRRYADGRHLKT